MITLLRTLLLISLIALLPTPLTACGPEVQIVKKPEGLRKNNPDPSNPVLTTEDRLRWKSVLNWCDECDERFKGITGSYDERDGRIQTYPIGDNQYIVDISCLSAAYSGEHIYYKVTERTDTVESQLLILEQFDHAEYDDDTLGQGIKDPKGEFMRFTDSLCWGVTIIPKKKNQKQLIIERRFRGMGGCGLYTVYDVDGDCPEVIEFRAKVECTADSPPPEEWKLYPTEQRAKWRTIPNPLREDWRASPALSR
jgi:hypothetical protein